MDTVNLLIQEIDSGQHDDSLITLMNRVVEAGKDREKVLAKRNIRQLSAGDYVRLYGLSRIPDGKVATIVKVARTRVTVNIDGRYYDVPASTVQLED